MACFFAFFTLFHLSLTFFRPEVPFKLACQDEGHLNKRNHMQNFFMPYFHQFSWGSFDFRWRMWIFLQILETMAERT